MAVAEETARGGTHMSAAAAALDEAIKRLEARAEKLRTLLAMLEEGEGESKSETNEHKS